MQSIISNKKTVFIYIISALIIFSFTTKAFSQESSNGNGTQMKLLQPGVTAPINVLKDIYDEDRSFPILGKWNLIFYWSLFCHSCIEEMPEILKKLEELKDKDFNAYFVSLDTDKMQKALKNFEKRRKFNSPILMEKIVNEKYITADTWGVTMTPTVFIVNPEGKIIYSNQGPIDLELFFKNLPQELVEKAMEQNE